MANIKRFEYQFLTVSLNVETVSGPGGFGQAQDVLNTHGHDGWEVVQLVVMTPVTHKYLLKRETPAASTQPALSSLTAPKKKGFKP